MVHWWQDPEVEDHLSALYVNMMFLLLGVYGWEYFQTFGVIEYAIVRRRLPFRWSLVPYLAGRVTHLANLLLLALGMSRLPFDCQPGAFLSAVLGSISIGSSSMNLMIRTWVIWKESRLIHFLVSLVALGHWAMLTSDVVNIRSYRSNGVCVIYLLYPGRSAVVFVYTMCYDFLVLVLSIAKLSKQDSTKSPLTDRLRAQGLLYFAIAAVAYIPPTVFAFLGSTSMVGITGTTAMTASMIGSCRAVRSLLVLRTPHPRGNLDGAERGVVLTTQVEDHVSDAMMDIR